MYYVKFLKHLFESGYLGLAIFKRNILAHDSSQRNKYVSQTAKSRWNIETFRPGDEDKRYIGRYTAMHSSKNLAERSRRDNQCLLVDIV